jgi:hypothetical protein
MDSRSPSPPAPSPPPISRSPSPDIGPYHLEPPAAGDKLEAWNSWCTRREVNPTHSYNVSRRDRDDWRKHRDNYISRKLAEETEERLQIAKAMSDDARTAELLRKVIAKPDHYDGN